MVILIFFLGNKQGVKGEYWLYTFHDFCFHKISETSFLRIVPVGKIIGLSWKKRKAIMLTI